MICVSINGQETYASAKKVVISLSELVDLPWDIFKFNISVKVIGGCKVVFFDGKETCQISNKTDLHNVPSNAKFSCVGDGVFNFEVTDIEVDEQYNAEFGMKDGMLFCSWNSPKGLSF